MPLTDEHLYVLRHSKQAGGTTVVVKIAAVRERFAALNIPDLRLQIIFDDKQAYFKESSEELLSNGVMHICQLTFNPLSSYSYCAEWKELGRFPMVCGNLYAVPTLDWRNAGFSKREIHALIDEQIRFLMKESQEHSTWRIDVDFLFRENVVFSRATCRTNNEETQNEMAIGPRSARSVS